MGPSLRYLVGLSLMTGLLVAYAHYRNFEAHYAKFEQSQQRVRQLRGELEARKKEEAQLERDVTNLNKDPVEWEATIRRTKGWVRPGEKIYRVVIGPGPERAQ